MSLTSPSIGEYLDRLSILRLKIHHGELAQKSVEHFSDERQEILARIPPSVSFNDPKVEELFFVNEMLWEMTDEFRTALADDVVDVQARFGRLILKSNDRRAQLIAQISAQYGDFRQEKV